MNVFQRMAVTRFRDRESQRHDRAAALRGGALADLADLLTMLPPARDDSRLDAQLWAIREGALEPQLPEPVTAALEALALDRTAENAWAVVAAAEAAAEDPRWSEAYARRLEDAKVRGAYYGHEWGDERCTRVLLGAVYSRLLDPSTARDTPDHVGLWSLFMDCASTLSGSDYSVCGNVSTRYALHSVVLQTLADTWATMRAAAAPDEPEPAPATCDVLADYTDDGRESVAARVPAEPEAPSVIVVRSNLRHLPGPMPKEGKGNAGAGTPKGEFGPLALRPVPLALTPDLADVRDALAPEFPHAARSGLLDALLDDLVGRETVRLRPMLLAGAPGCGKTRLARRLAEELGVPLVAYACGGSADGSLGGTSRQWSTGRASVPLQAIRQHGTANPVILLDEVEKASQARANGALVDVLLGLLEPETSARFHDPYIEAPTDLSHVSYLLTCNDLALVPAPLRSRCRVLEMPAALAEDLPVLAPQVLAAVRADRGLDAAWLPDLAPDELDVLRRVWRGGDLRRLRAAVERLIAGRDAFARALAH